MPLYIKQATTFDFLIILHDSRALCVMDSRDRGYAFLSLARSAGLQLDLRPDYRPSKTPEQVYLDLAIQYIVSTGDLSLIHCVQQTEDSFRDSLASWVPRWDINIFSNIIVHTSAPALIPLTTKPVILDRNILRTTGVGFDEILFTSEPLTRTVSMQKIGSIWRRVSDIRLNSEPLYKSTTLDFCKVLSVGRSWGAERSEWAEWRTAYIQVFLEKESAQVPADHPNLEGIKNFHTYAQWNVHNRKIIVTKSGLVGLVPVPTEDGDSCCILLGAKAPSIVRRSSGRNEFRLIGDTFLAGELSPNYAEKDGRLEALRSKTSKELFELKVEEQIIDLC
jgi:hypothetical protein